ncbi:MAG: NAD(P)-dependent oxidoreductase [Bryobacterales bacterium]|nr:NAD(P)-dependent oxidoreductase [Bryobacterales bacterium]
MERTIFLAGASGAIGRRLAPLLVADGWRVVGTTRAAEKTEMLRKLGVEPVVLDVFDAEALRRTVVGSKPEIVIHQLTDLPPGLAADQMPEALVRNARIRDEGTRNLVSAAVEAGAKRMIAQSIAMVYAEGPLPHREEDPLIPVTDPDRGGTVAGVLSLERQVLNAPFEGIVLRYGLLYGPGTGFETVRGSGPVHVDAAAKAAELAVTRGEPGIYNIAEPDGTIAIEKAVRAFGWDAGWRAESSPSV